MRDVFVLGSINVDLVIVSPKIPKKGETIHGSDFYIGSGGKGANQAVASGKSGSKTYMIGCVGDDVLSQGILKDLKNYCVDTSFVKIIEGASTGVAMITVVGGDNRIILSSGTNNMITTGDIDEALSHAKKGDVLLTQNEIKEEMNIYGLKKARERQMVTVFNPAPAHALSLEMLKYIDIIIPNEIEAMSITSTDSLDNAIGALKQSGVKQIIITLGEDGCMLIDGGEVKKFPARKVNAIDTTAAGDTFIGVVGSGLASGNTLSQIIPRATAASAITVTRKGAQAAIPYASEVDEFCK